MFNFLILLPPGWCSDLRYNGSKGYTYNGVPTLAIGLCYGRVQVSTGVDEKTALSIRTGICLKHIKWSYDGSMLALGGKQQVGQNHEEVLSDINGSIYST